jgi:hypothetical protein
LRKFVVIADTCSIFQTASARRNRKEDALNLPMRQLPGVGIDELSLTPHGGISASPSARSARLGCVAVALHRLRYNRRPASSVLKCIDVKTLLVQ